MNFSRTTTGMLIAAVALGAGAGCGGDGDDTLSKEQTGQQVDRAVTTVNGEFRQLFEQLGSRGEDERVPVEVRDRLRAVADIERRAADEIDAIEPAAETRGAVDRFVRVAHAQADTLERAAERESLSVGEVADAVELPEMRGALDELERQQLTDIPEHQ